MKLIVSIATIFAAFFSLTVSGVEQNPNRHTLSINCAPRLQKNLQAIYKIPEARKLIANIYKEGPISIEVQNSYLSNQFGAFWDQEHRVICVAIGPSTTEGEIIGSIIFEMHNAAVSAQFERLDHMASNGQISREKYVESVEYIEYLNSLKASAIANRGIREGIFPETAFLPTYRDFNEHFYYQKQGGHSAWIAQSYDHLRNGVF